MRLLLQAILILAVLTGAFVGWALYLPAARPFLDRVGVLDTLEEIGLVNAAQVAAPEERSNRGGGGPIRVLAEPVTARVMNDRTVAIGTAQSARSVVLSTEISGKIATLDVASGIYVEAGDHVATLDERAARIARDRAELGLEDQRRNLTRLQRLRGSGSVTELQAQEAEVAMAAAELAVRDAELQLDRHRIDAPIAGWVGLIEVSPGDLVATGARITTIEDRASLLVGFRVPERMANRIAVGDRVDAASLADPGRKLEARISAIDNRVDEASRSLRVQATLPNVDDRLRPGMAISLTIDLVGGDYPAIDPLAIQWGSNGAYVWVLRDGKAMQLPIRIMQRNADDALVEGEFQPGDLVVNEGVMSLRPGVEAEAVQASSG
jgi:RND family efflux transporter MFP subunit